MWSSFPVCMHFSKSDADNTGKPLFPGCWSICWSSKTDLGVLHPSRASHSSPIPASSVHSEWDYTVKPVKFCRSFWSNQTKEKAICNYVNEFICLLEKWFYQRGFSTRRADRLKWRKSICSTGAGQQRWDAERIAMNINFMPLFILYTQYCILL